MNFAKIALCTGIILSATAQVYGSEPTKAQKCARISSTYCAAMKKGALKTNLEQGFHACARKEELVKSLDSIETFFTADELSSLMESSKQKLADLDQEIETAYSISKKYLVITFG